LAEKIALFRLFIVIFPLTGLFDAGKRPVLFTISVEGRPLICQEVVMNFLS